MMELSNYRQWLQDAEDRVSLETAVRGAVVSLGADEGSLLVPVEGNRQLEFVLCCTHTGINSTLMGQRLPITDGLVGKTMLTGETQIDAPVFKNLIQADFAAADYGNPASIIAVAVKYGELRFGVMTLASFNPGHRFSTEEASRYEAFASLVGLLLHKQSMIMALSGQATTNPTDPTSRLQQMVGNIVINSPERIEAAIRVLETIITLK